jgi:pyruvate dehydrogenase E2 component (dihydrolipoamide acetyltransferase)
VSAPATEAKAITLPTFVGEERYIEKPVNQMRKTIAARRLGRSHCLQSTLLFDCIN